VLKNFDEDDAEGTMEVPVDFKDVKVLNLTDTDAPFPTAADNDFIAETEEEFCCRRQGTFDSPYGQLVKKKLITGGMKTQQIQISIHVTGKRP
jgi:hypothetical protein